MSNDPMQIGRYTVLEEIGSGGFSFEGFGGEVVLATAVGKGQEDMLPVLTQVAASGAELVYLPIFGPAANFFVLQAEEVGLEVAGP